MSRVVPIILSGGSGTRLWPVSRATRPKQFLAIESERTLFQQTLMRCGRPVFEDRPIIVGSNHHRFLIAESLAEIGVAADILLEPVARNSCAAIAAGCLQAVQRDPDAIVLALAADHHIPDTTAFAAAVETGIDDAADGFLIAFGVRPDRPATGYGYICPGKPLKAARRVEAFVEKPDAKTAKRYLEEGYLWNSGNFLFRASAFLEELARLQPAILSAVKDAFLAAATDLDFVRLDVENFASAPSISVDYAVMEKTARAAVLAVEYQWSDIGSWDAVAGLIKTDDSGNGIIGSAEIVGGRNNLVHSPHILTTVVGISDAVIVTTRDAVLVADKAHVEDVKVLVERLRERGRDEADTALQVFRPWGNYEQLDIGDGYQVKRITVNPGGELSLQKHRHRAEHWVVVQGKAEVTLGSQVTTLEPNQSTYIPLGEIHRLANRGEAPVVLIEVQTGDYLGEDDIIRLEDRYNRSAEPASATK